MPAGAAARHEDVRRIRAELVGVLAYPCDHPLGVDVRGREGRFGRQSIVGAYAHPSRAREPKEQRPGLAALPAVPEAATVPVDEHRRGARLRSRPVDVEPVELAAVSVGQVGDPPHRAIATRVRRDEQRDPMTRAHDGHAVAETLRERALDNRPRPRATDRDDDEPERCHDRDAHGHPRGCRRHVAARESQQRGGCQQVDREERQLVELQREHPRSHRERTRTPDGREHQDREGGRDRDGDRVTDWVLSGYQKS